MATSGRHVVHPLGNDREYVQQANAMAGRMCLLIYLVEAWSARWWMGHYGAKTPKRHVAWSSSPKVGLLNRGKLSWASMRGRDYDKHKTAVTGVSKSGKKTFQGRKQQLKASQWLSSNERWVFQGCYTNEPCCYKGL
ncbi:unnamed protein product [Durusdinium trenchii]|uniref:Uncharacterized protein n=1 Tax=Durusdinium trenchii TaxID=1381693 RepID=A0ABP0PID8_9DINO